MKPFPNRPCDSVSLHDESSSCCRGLMPGFGWAAGSQALLEGRPLDLSLALELLKFPKELGTHEGRSVILDIGRFGPYIKLGETTASVPQAMLRSEMGVQCPQQPGLPGTIAMHTRSATPFKQRTTRVTLACSIRGASCAVYCMLFSWQPAVNNFRYLAQWGRGVVHCGRRKIT